MSRSSGAKKLYIAGVGMITPVGANAAMTAAAVRAGISAYEVSRYFDQSGRPIIMGCVPEGVFVESTAEIDEGVWYSEHHDCIIKMGIVAIHEACSQQREKKTIPLVLAMPDVLLGVEHIGDESLIGNLATNCQPWINAYHCRAVHSGRAAGLVALEQIFAVHDFSQSDFVLFGGSDSHRDYSRLRHLGAMERLLVPGGNDGFAPGEAAGFLLLTHRPDMAQIRNGCIIALSQPGLADEPGHFYNDEPYRGDGLDQAFKTALAGLPEQSIDAIYSSMNGENHWAKEYGVAYLRNRAAFRDPVRVEHPADCFGDLGAATSSVLIGLAADDLWNSAHARTHLVYSSSDAAKRGAVVVEKIVVR